MGSKAPGNYLDQFWSNRILVLLCEGPKPANSMISGFLSPGGTLFMGFNIPNYYKKYKKSGHIFENVIFVNLRI